MQRARKIQKFLSQPFFVAEQFTGIPGRYVKLADTIRSFKALVSGQHDHLPEQAFYMKGDIDEVVEAAAQMGGGAGGTAKAEPKKAEPEKEKAAAPAAKA